jgi:predicted nucleotidyltransferase
VRDLLVDLPEGAGRFTVARLQRELEEILSARVAIVPAGDLKPDVRTEVERDHVAL